MIGFLSRAPRPRPPARFYGCSQVSSLSTLKYVDAWCVFFWATTPTLVCLVTFATLVVVRGEGAPPFRVSSVFTGGLEV